MSRFRPVDESMTTAGSNCLKCGDAIEMVRQGDLARTTYFCPTCQRPLR